MREGASAWQPVGAKQQRAAVEEQAGSRAGTVQPALRPRRQAETHAGGHMPALHARLVRAKYKEYFRAATASLLV